MAIIFPASPSQNDVFTEGSITYKYDGAKWIGVGITPVDRLVEGSNKLEIDSNNHLIWTGGDIGLGSTTINQQSGGRTVLSLNGTDNALLNFNHSDTLAGFMYGANDEFRMESNGTRPLVFRSNSETRLKITSAGHFLVAQSTSNWGTSSDNSVIQLKNSLIWDYAGIQFDVGHNYYYDGAYKYIRDGYASRLAFHNNTGDVSFWSATTGSADATLTWGEKLRILHSGTIQSVNSVQTGGNGTGGFKFTSQYSGKGYDIATQYATQGNGGSGGTDPMFSGWWGTNNTLRINTDGQIKARTIELQSPTTDSQFAKWQVLTGAKEVNGNGTTNELFKIGHSAMGRLQVWCLHGKDDYSSGMRSRVVDVQLIYGNPSLQEESAHSSNAVDGTLTDITVAYNNSGGSIDYIITAAVTWNTTNSPGTPWVYWTWEGTNSIRPYNI